MYLGELNIKQKEAFLDLGIYLAAADNDFSDNEKKAIDLLCEEMQIAKRYAAVCSPGEAIAAFTSNSDPRAQRIVIVELLGIALADEFIVRAEKDLIAKVAAAFKMAPEQLPEISAVITELYGVYKKLNRFLGQA